MAAASGLRALVLGLRKADTLCSRTCSNVFLARSMSTSSSPAGNEKIYELRTYNVKPECFRSFMETLMEGVHVRTLHSKLTACWISEIGGLNDAIFLWEYNSLGQRSTVRHSISLDTEWQNTVLPKLLPTIQRQENSIVTCLPGTGLGDLRDTGVYELQQFDHDGRPIDDIAAALQLVDKPGAEHIGSFYTLIGPRSTGFRLWRYNSIYDVVPGPLKINQSSGIKFGHSRLMMPTKWSEMQDV